MRFRRWHFVALVMVVLHGIMLIYDADNARIFLSADRAKERWDVAQEMLVSLKAGTGVQYLASHGNAGDYLVQGFAYQFLGKAGLIAAQVLLTLLSGWAVMRMALHLGLNDNTATAAAGIYLLLPHTLVFPHQLASEAIYTPLLVISLWLAISALRSDRWQAASASGMTLACANLIRPVTLVWPFIVTAVFFGAKRWRSGCIQLGCAMLPALLWMTFLWGQTGNFGMGASSRDLQHNLYQRITRVSETMAPEQILRIRQTYLTQGAVGNTSPVQYLTFATDYPLPFIKHSLRDVAIFFVKSGVERVSIDYLGLGGAQQHELQNSSAGWRARLEQQGIVATTQYLWQTQGMVLMISVIGAGLMALFSLLSLFGLYSVYASRASFSVEQRVAAGLIAALPVYILVFSQLVDAMQSRHRAPAEAAMVLLAAYGLSRLRANRKLSALVVPDAVRAAAVH